jgi:hypothetical protein
VQTIEVESGLLSVRLTDGTTTHFDEPVTVKYHLMRSNLPESKAFARISSAILQGEVVGLTNSRIKHFLSNRPNLVGYVNFERVEPESESKPSTPVKKLVKKEVKSSIPTSPKPVDKTDHDEGINMKKKKRPASEDAMLPEAINQVVEEFANVSNDLRARVASLVSEVVRIQEENEEFKARIEAIETSQLTAQVEKLQVESLDHPSPVPPDESFSTSDPLDGSFPEDFRLDVKLLDKMIRKARMKGKIVITIKDDDYYRKVARLCNHELLPGGLIYVNGV